VQPGTPLPAHVTAERGAQVVVTAPDGSVRTYPLGPHPLTMGTDPTCDIVVTGSRLRSLHARIALAEGDTYRVHGIGHSSPRRYEGSDPDEWLIVDRDETLHVGGYALCIGPTADRDPSPGP
jgi:hypothetical protein